MHLMENRSISDTWYNKSALKEKCKIRRMKINAKTKKEQKKNAFLGDSEPKSTPT